ncbi:MAG: hypothetical protein U0V49_02775 [Saprospiraceae bacterium]
MKSKVPWKIKMDKPANPVIEEGPEKWNTTYAGHRMVIPTPRIIEKILLTIPKGSIMILSEFRRNVAEACEADYACPLTTGIFLRICSEYAEELRAEGAKKIPPYWRVVRDDGSLIDKFPGAELHQSELLKKEGFKIIYRGIRKKRLAVEL